VTDTPETAEWEPDEPDTPAEADTTPTDEQPATPPEPPTGMKYDASGKLVEPEGIHEGAAKFTRPSGELDAWGLPPVAWDRAESEPCERGTVGYSVKHSWPPHWAQTPLYDNACETW
jgi:hypothetical protein